LSTKQTLHPYPTVHELFQTFKSSAFRIEALDLYAVDSDKDQFKQYLSGIPLRSDDPDDRTWCNFIEAATKSGKTVRRVHVISGPLTPYLRFEIDWGYAYNQMAGEQIFILHRPDARTLLSDEPLKDFWLFDESTVAEMIYDKECHFLGAQITTDAAVVSECIRQRDIALRHAQSLPDYLSRLRSISFDLLASEKPE
jgi:hypothetical protein